MADGTVLFTPIRMLRTVLYRPMGNYTTAMLITGVVIGLGGVGAFQVSTLSMMCFQKFVPSSPIPSSATEPVPKGSTNSIRTTWTAPSDVTGKQAIDQVKTVFESYPQQGQQNIDQGGWKVADGSFEKGVFRLEYTSGVGFFARLLNGGQGFVDDVLVHVMTTETPVRAELRSSSRMGKSDLGVNQKRLAFLAQEIRKQGWEAPNPTYPK